MKSIIIFIIAIYGFQALPTMDSRWEAFKVAYGKNYTDIEEDSFRKDLFMKKLHEVKEHNQKYEDGLVSYKAGINKFSDYTNQEKQFLTNRLPTPSDMKVLSNFTFTPRRNTQLPDKVDWREKGIVPPVKDQSEDCGSCWAFSVVGATECHYRLYKNQEVSLSEQQLVDCDKTQLGCRGGISLINSFVYIRDTGLNTENDYPYEAVNGECRYNSEKPHYTVSGFVDVAPGREDYLQAAVAEKGPVSVIVDATGNFEMYESGIYYNPDCNPNFLTHAVVIVGYGTEDGQDYWLVRNSMSDQWGDHGYLKMARNRDNHCGIASMPSYPVV